MNDEPLAEPQREPAESMLRRIFSRLDHREFEVGLAGRTVLTPTDQGRASCRFEFRSPAAVRRLFRRPSSLTFGEAYASGDVEVEGSMACALRVAERLLESSGSVSQRIADWWQLRSIKAATEPPLVARHAADLQCVPLSRERMKEAITFHYDLPISFWQPWLDEQLVYSCAYFETPETELDAAQSAKLDLVCRKLRLRRGEKFLDMGAGWGGLALHAARYYGVNATGVTLSPRQAQFATERIRASGMAEQCRVEERDLWDLKGPASFDKIAAVGSIEHVARTLLPKHFKRVFALLRPGGVFLNHGMTLSASRPLFSGPSFIDRYIFPDASFVSVSETLRAAENAGFEVRDVENLREHYALTLEKWIERFQKARPTIETLTSLETFRIFYLYLEGSKYHFERGALNLHQTLLLRPEGRPSDLPLTRRDWFERRAPN
jgi:cyclopropane-fatty-acyl-phospholipid synthase